jgi:ATP-dependent RNA helicase DeaD
MPPKKKISVFGLSDGPEDLDESTDIDDELPPDDADENADDDADGGADGGAGDVADAPPARTRKKRPPRKRSRKSPARDAAAEGDGAGGQPPGDADADQKDETAEPRAADDEAEPRPKRRRSRGRRKPKSAAASEETAAAGPAEDADRSGEDAQGSAPAAADGAADADAVGSADAGEDDGFAPWDERLEEAADPFADAFADVETDAGPDAEAKEPDETGDRPVTDAADEDEGPDEAEDTVAEESPEESQGTPDDGRPAERARRPRPRARGAEAPASGPAPAPAPGIAPEAPAPVTLESLSPAQRAAVTAAGWPGLMPVQERAIPYVTQGRDVMVQARTGSGKTAAFVLPLLEILDPAERHCQALVLVPTRELAQQVAREAQMLFGDSGLSVIAVYGGVGYREQMEAFRAGAQLVVGTPGRVLDHLMKRALTLDYLRVLVFDEADRMLSVGFYPDMKAVQRYLPSRLHGAFMFSATYPYNVLRLADEFLRAPELLSLSADQVHVADISHQFCEVPPMGKERRLVRLIELENPSSAIVFCNTKRNVEFVTAVLQRFGYDAEELSSSLTQAKREQVLGRIREGRLRFLVATDVAARGIDIPELSHVFLYEPPEDPESYIHRAGRTYPWWTWCRRPRCSASARATASTSSSARSPRRRTSSAWSRTASPCSWKRSAAASTRSRRSAPRASIPWRASWPRTTRPWPCWPCSWTTSTSAR